MLPVGISVSVGLSGSWAMGEQWKWNSNNKAGRAWVLLRLFFVFFSLGWLIPASRAFLASRLSPSANPILLQYIQWHALVWPDLA
ncbi:uncharacterized protein FFB20_15476 [Fusarium fujikuroi]|nr:uncharacterized protein FFC1_03535 [Fusarium fujikuroi]SCO03353.1 uncharacterized protein FFE2_10307 [Fusarium fujikuroi]SCO07685.1 uncharacterized protein FFM5_09158 [Fusarium fujikuroi]SCO18379.1 uncharacterized protein FFB20_15476 [Fusarium fujikuroi]SCO32622.1 uncharacterized protein FFNC_02991 [Fusarium fujikuroi]